MTMTASTSVGGDEEDPPPPPSAALGVVVRGVDGGGEGDGGVAPEPNGNGPAAQAPDENPEANGKGGGGGSDEEDGVAFVGDVVAPPDDDGRGDGAPEKGAEEGAPRPPPPATGPAKRNLNSYYGHKIGAYQTISLLLNAGLMLYAHLGLSAVILTSQDPTLTESASASANGDVNDEVPSQPPPPPGECSTRDREIWIADGGASKRPERSNHCSRTYNGGCFLNSTCISECFQEVQGYSPECAICFGEIPSCSVRNGCTMVCAADSLGEECRNCNKPCIVELDLCTGLPDVNANDNQFQINDTDTDAGAPVGATTEGNSCNQFDLGAIDKWYTAYNLTFVRSVRDAWTGDAKLLAVIIVIFSGIWPYLKNIMLVMIWYIPASVETQTDTLLWLSRLSKYTLVDVFSVIGVLVGVQLQLNVGGTEAVTRAEPRFGIIAFFLATVWEFLQIELIKAMHERKVLAGTNESGRERLLFPKLWTPVLILVTSLALYISGAVTEIVYFSSADYGSAGVCKRSYNLVTLGNALINEHSMTGNSAKGQTWILYLSYVVLNLAFPIITHLLQICFIAGWFRSKILKRLIEWTLAIWCFACIEVLLIGIFAVEYKFPNLIMRIAGDTNAGFLDIDSQLGVGFYILIAYSIVAGLLQNSLRIRHAEAYLE
ncbi:hypothetical protein ACHAWF_008018 [Thalassiosira exigua]